MDTARPEDRPRESSGTRIVAAFEVAAWAAALRALALVLLDERLSGENLAAGTASIAVAAAVGGALGLVARRRALVLLAVPLLALSQFGTTLGTTLGAGGAPPAAGLVLREDAATDAWRVVLALVATALLVARAFLLPRWQRAAAALAVLAAAGSGAAWWQAQSVLHGQFERWHTLTSVLESPALYRAAVEHPERPVGLATFAPTTISARSGGPRPALLTAPPARVHVEVPYEWSDAHASLELAVGLDEGAWKELGRSRGVRFRARSGDAVLFEKVLVREGYDGPALAHTTSAREWHEARLALAGLDEVVLEVETTDGSAVSGEFVCGIANLLVLVPHSGRRALSSPRAPNLVFVLADTLRADAVDFAPDGRTPHLAALAARGTRFERAFAASSWTWPSTASLLTGLTPPEHGVVDMESNYLSERFTTLPESLQAEGFTTAAWSTNPLVSRAKNFDQGFETFEQTEWERASTTLPAVRAWLAEHRRHRFFLYLHFTDPHDPYEPPEDVRRAFGLVDPRGYSTEALEELHRRRGERTPHERERWPKFVAHAHELYRAEVHDLDRSLGVVFAELERLGLDDRTLIVVTSDHGEEFIEHDRLGHGTQLFDETTHVPLLLAGPGVPAGERRANLVENRHLAGTLLRLVGAATPAGAEATDLFVGAPPAEAWLSTSLGFWRGVGERELFGLRDERWLYVLGQERGGERRNEALFDLELDAAARDNRAKRDRERAAAYRTRVAAWLERARAVRPVSFGSDASTLEMLAEFGYVDNGASVDDGTGVGDDSGVEDD
jgi:arylsulfatase A-like enzyme